MSGTGGLDAPTLLFITNSRIGDAVLSTGLLDHLIRAHPGLRVTVACGRVAAPLFEGVPGLERLHVLHKRPRAGHWRDLWRQVVGRRWDVLVDLRGSPLPWLLRAQRRLRPDRDRSGPEHTVRRVGSALGPDGRADPPAPRLWTRPADEAAAAEALGLASPDAPTPAPILALAPTANWIGKVWPADRFITLARHLTGPEGALPDARIAVLAGPQERAAVTPVLQALAGPRLIDLTGGRLHLLGVSAALARCRLFVGNDSGLMHMAAATGIPTIGLFGPSPDALYAPWGPHGRAVRTDKPYADLFPPGLDPASVTGTLMESLPVSRVVDAVDALLRDVAAGESRR